MTHNKPPHTQLDAPFLDDEEQALIEGLETALEVGSITPSTPQQRSKHADDWKQIVRNTAERKAITLRLQQRDIERLKVIARQKGLPYQTLVSSVLHQFANGDLVERRI